MQQSISSPTPERPKSSESYLTPKLRTITGNCLPRKRSYGCGREITRVSAIGMVVDFSSGLPYPS